jgi:hypothetical protein
MCVAEEETLNWYKSPNEKKDERAVNKCPLHCERRGIKDDPPDPTAMPISAAFSAGASLTPSPVIPTT